MKKFLIFSLILILLVGVFAPSGVAFSAPVPGGGSGGYTTNTNGTVNQNAQSNTTSNLSAIIMGALSGISYFILTAMGWLLWLSGMLLNLVLDQTIIKFTANIGTMTGINTAWKVIRDVMNMFFIFILLYNAIMIIISQKNRGDIQKIVGGIVITALLINFSMFFTKVIIDASNIATIGFYNSIINAGQSTVITTGTDSSGNPLTSNLRMGISGAFANALHITSFYSSNGIANQPAPSSMVIIYLGGAILFLIVAFVLFAIAAMFVIRYVAFILLLMFSPLGFIGFGLPQLKGAQDDWWKILKGQAIFAPLYMFLTWVILTLMGSDGFIPKSGALADINNAADPTAQMGAIALIINFAVIIILIIFSLTKSKEYAEQGSKYLSQATGKLTAFAGGVAMGGSAAIMRNTAGRYANNKANDQDLKDRAAKGDKLAQLQLKTYRAAAAGSFDLRRSSAGEQIAKSTGVNFGKGIPFNEKSGQGGFKKAKEEKAKKEQEYAKSLKPSDEEYEIAKEKDAEIKAAQAKLKDAGFIAEEKRRKDGELNSEKYKNSEMYLNAEKEKTENEANEAKVITEKEKQAKLDAELKEIEKLKQSASYLLDQQKRKEIDDNISAKKREIEDQNEIISKLKESIEKNSVATKERQKYENEWKSKDKSDLEELAKQEANNEKELENIWKERKNNYADSVENAWMKRYSMTILGGLAGAALGGPIGAGVGAAVGKSFGGTKAEQEHIARKIRNETGKKKEMTKKEKAELRKKLDKLEDKDSDEAKEIKKKLGWDEEDKELEE